MTRCKIHQYLLTTRHGDNLLIYRCANCTHYLPAEQAVGLDTICWRCKKVTKLTRKRVGRYTKRPHCAACTKVYNRKDAPAIPAIDLKKLEAMSIEDLLKDEE
jgi:hypothetical protein